MKRRRDVSAPPGGGVASESARRESFRSAVLRHFLAQRGIWIGIHELARVGGFAAWRTRVAEARAIVERDGDTIEWNGRVHDSRYRLVVKALGPRAEVFRERRLF